jgi:glycosyltransferase involved in cell wall biosynthesis
MARWKAVNWTRYHQIFTLLAELGHEVHVIQSPPQKSIETNFQEIKIDLPENLHLHEVEINSYIWNQQLPLNKLIKKGYYSFKSVKKVKEIIKRYNIDVLFLYNIPQYPLLKFSSCLKIFDFADDYNAMLKHELGKFSNPLIFKIGNRILNEMIKKSDLTFAVSQVLADSIAVNGNKIYVIPNGVNIKESSWGSGQAIREKLRKPIVGFIGAFEYFIDFELILNTAERLTQYTFLLVGTGREYQKVKNSIETKKLKNIILTGGLPHAEVIKHIDAMDICLNVFKKIPISHGACPIKLFEYLSMKKPVISTRLDEVKNIDTGFLFYADTEDELVGEIKKIIFGGDLVAEYIEKGYSITKTQYNWHDIAQKILNIIEETRSNKGFCR